MQRYRDVLKIYCTILVLLLSIPLGRVPPAQAQGDPVSGVPQNSLPESIEPIIVNSAVSLSFDRSRTEELYSSLNSYFSPELLVQYPIEYLSVNPATQTPQYIKGGPFLLQQQDVDLLNNMQAYGITDASLLENVGRNIIQNYQSILGVAAPENLQRTMAREVADGLYYVFFQQYEAGVPVAHAYVRVVFSRSGRVPFISSMYHANIDVDPAASLSSDEVLNIAREDLGFEEATGEVLKAPELMILPLVLDKTHRHHLVYRLTLLQSDPLAHWEYYVDAHTGKIFGRQDRIARVDYEGRVRGTILPKYGTDTIQLKPLANMNILGGTVTDADGLFVYSAGPLTTQAQLEGPYINYGPNNFSKTITFDDPGEIVEVVWDDPELLKRFNVFYHLNYMHDYIIQKLEYEEFDNAFPNGLRAAIMNGTSSFYNASDGVVALGGEEGDFHKVAALYSDVIYHEYAHALTSVVYGGTIENQWYEHMDEGYSDYMACHLNNDPVAGDHFYKKDEEGLDHPWYQARHCRNDEQMLSEESPSGNAHMGSAPYKGALWDVRRRMMNKYGTLDAANQADKMIHQARLLQPMSYKEMLMLLLVIDEQRAEDPDVASERGLIISSFASHGIDYIANISVDITHDVIVDDDHGGASSGNGNRAIEPGEKIELTLTIDNQSNIEFLNVTAVLSSGHPAVSWIQPEVLIPQIAPLEQKDVTFVFEVSEALELFSEISFDFNAEYSIRAGLGEFPIEGATQSFYIPANISRTKLMRAPDECIPRVGGAHEDFLVWSDARSGNHDVYLYNLKSRKEHQLTSEGDDQTSPVVYGNRVVWEQWSLLGQSNLLMTYIDPGTGQKASDYVVISQANKNQINPVIYEDVIVWEDYRDTNIRACDTNACYANRHFQDIYMFVDDGTGEVPIGVSQYPEAKYPDVFGDNVVWSEIAYDWIVEDYTYNIWVHNIPSGESRILIPDADAEPKLTEDRVFFRRFRSLLNEQMFDPDTGEAIGEWSGLDLPDLDPFAPDPPRTDLAASRNAEFLAFEEFEGPNRLLEDERTLKVYYRPESRAVAVGSIYPNFEPVKIWEWYQSNPTFVSDTQIAWASEGCVWMANLFTVHEPEKIWFWRGDANGDGSLDIADPVYILFNRSQPEQFTCQDAADINDDGVINVQDVIHFLVSHFLMQADIPLPDSRKGADTTPDNLGCAKYPSL